MMRTRYPGRGSHASPPISVTTGPSRAAVCCTNAAAIAGSSPLSLLYTDVSDTGSVSATRWYAA